ncbi:hypothetical protein SNE40_009162 [Patella caerulea]|uniref:Uncharacterized protein n=1 Tax=Patella caerulea TaxID=87958 RepID=A0AAN8PRJ3_PATCE
MSGGLNIPDIKLRKHAFRLQWTKKFLVSKGKIWTSFIKFFLNKYENLKLSHELLFINYSQKGLKDLPEFYKDILTAWDIVTNPKRVKYTTYTEIVNQPPFYNSNILLNSKPLYFPNYVSTGLRKIYDISYVFVPGLLPTIIDCFDLDEDSDDDCKHEEKITKQYKQIVSSLPRDWVDIINTPTVVKHLQIYLSNLKTGDNSRL